MQEAKLKGFSGQELELAINTVRTLSIDAVQQAKSGHPGTPMALAPLVYMIRNEVLRFDPQAPIWPNRDRFVLSNGHASMLLWSVLYLTRTQAVNADYETVGKPSVTLDDINGSSLSPWSCSAAIDARARRAAPQRHNRRQNVNARQARSSRRIENDTADRERLSSAALRDGDFRRRRRPDQASGCASAL
jgi:Transketolase, thiamine diphosphate binding domain